MSRRTQPAACACGQVMFETAERKAGDVLTCPWCDKKYTYLGDDKIEPLGAGKKVKSEKNEKSEKAEKTEAKRKRESVRDDPKVLLKSEAPGAEKKGASDADDAPAASDKKEKSKGANGKESSGEPGGEADPAEGGTLPAVVRIAPKNIRDKKPRDTGARAPLATATAGADSQRAKQAARRPKDIPGGVIAMVAYIVIFNGLAFMAIRFIFPTLPASGGMRDTPWGDALPKSSLLPELIALTVGHVVGFVFWSWYVYTVVRKQSQEQAQANT